MNIKFWYLSNILLLNFTFGVAQQFLFGKTSNYEGIHVLIGVKVHNLRTKISSTSDFGGNYRITAENTDTIIFSYSGYVSDTVIVKPPMLFKGWNAFLAPNIVSLPQVEVDYMGKYVNDSTQRRKDYAFILDKQHSIKFMNEKRLGDPPGLNFSPISYFSKHEREIRRLKKRIKEEDEEEYVDLRFSISRVEEITLLNGDTLRRFILLFRPSYKLCRKLTNKDLLLYINDKLVLFKKNKKNKINYWVLNWVTQNN